MALSKPLESLIQASSAAMSGGLATVILFPLEKLKTRMSNAPTATLGEVCKIEKTRLNLFYLRLYNLIKLIKTNILKWF